MFLRNGKITNSGGHVAFNTSLSLDGGSYLETGNATRTFGANASMILQNGATVSLTNSVLQLNSGQAIDVEDSVLNSSEAIQLAGGIFTATGTMPTINAALDILTNGSVFVSSNTNAKFTEAVTNHDGQIMIESGAIVEFENTYDGLGTVGPGFARFSGEVSPGMSPGIVTFGGDAEWTDDARLIIELGGAAPGSWDQTIITNNALLGGELVVELIDLGTGVYAPVAGDEFPIIQANATAGQFETISLPSLAGNNRWVVSYQPEGVHLAVVSEGDYNGDGQVDVADFAVWRDQLGQTGQHLAADGNNDGLISELDHNVWAYELWLWRES